MSKIAFLTDIHGNFEALKSILEDIEQENITAIYHLGDSIAIGPKPKETIDLMNERNVQFLLGNHEIYYLGVMEKNFPQLSKNEIKHQLWVAKTLGNAYYKSIKTWSFEKTLIIDGVRIHLCHFPFITYSNGQKDFINIDVDINKSVFTVKDADLYIFGHNHSGFQKDIEGVIFINLDSSGVTKNETTSYLIVDINQSSFKLTTKTLKYNREKTILDINVLNVPDKEFIIKALFGIK